MTCQNPLRHPLQLSNCQSAIKQCKLLPRLPSHRYLETIIHENDACLRSSTHVTLVLNYDPVKGLVSGADQSNRFRQY